MSERTVDEALCRASELRGLEFRDDYSYMTDQDDLVVLADEVLRIRDPSLRACKHSPLCDVVRWVQVNSRVYGYSANDQLLKIIDASNADALAAAGITKITKSSSHT